MVGTEVVYFATGELGLDGGIMVTASHNPGAVHGDEDRAAGRAPGRQRVGPDRGARPCAAADWREATRGAVEAVDVWDAFVDRVLGFVDADAIAPLRVVVDGANGMAGAMLPRVLDRLPQVEVVRCNFEPDGSFPNHEPNPLLPENREFIVRRDARGGAPPSGSPTTATPTAASSSTTAASSSRATSRPRSLPSRCSRASRAAR